MIEPLPLFGDADAKPTADASDTAAGPMMMTSEQRATIREKFARLGVTAARDQFEIVRELTGSKIGSVQDISAATAQRAIQGLTKRLERNGAAVSGSAWDRREEDTWIDRL